MRRISFNQVPGKRLRRLFLWPLLFTAAAGLGMGSRITFTPGTISTVAGTGTAGNSGNGQSAIRATLRQPGAIAVDAAGNVYIADTENNVVRRIDIHTRIITAVAGTGVLGYSGDNGPAVAATLCGPRGLAFDAAQNLLIADSCNDAIRQVDANGVITTIAGLGPAAVSTYVGGSVGDNGPALNAILANPTGLAVDAAGNLYIANTGNHRIRRIDAHSHLITTVAGTGTAGYTNDGRAASLAQLPLRELLLTRPAYCTSPTQGTMWFGA